MNAQQRMNFLAAVKFTGPAGEKGDANYGYKWRVQVIKYGMGKDHQINWPREPLVAALPLIERSRVFEVTESQHNDPRKSLAFGKPVRELRGWLSNAVDTGIAIEADFDILTSATKLRSDLLDSFERGNPEFLGLSVDVDALSTTKMIAGKKVKEPVKIIGFQTDVVYDPTNEGKFLKMVAAAQADQHKEEDMYKKLLAALKGQRPEHGAQIDALMAKGDEVTDAEISQLMAAVMPGTQAVDVEKLVAAMKEGDKGGSILVADARKLLDQARLVACGSALSAEIVGSGLPDAVKEKLTAAFAGKVFEAAELQAAIKTEKDTLDKLTAAGLFSGGGAGGSRVEVQGEPERLQAAMDKTFGVKTEDKYADVHAFEGLRAAYVRMTGDERITGFISPEKLRAASYLTGTFATGLGNTLYRRILQDYREAPSFGLDFLISTKRSPKDFRAISSTNVGYFGDLPTVLEEGAYTDLSTLSDEDISYAILKKGGYIGITREMIMNDDVAMVNRIVSRLGRAGRRTKAKVCWTLLISNATYDGDSKAVYHADHSNLGSDALSIAALKDIKVNMAKQTDPGTNERLGLRPYVLAISSDLWGDAVDINQTRGVPGTDQFGNAFFQYFGANNERIVEVPFMTDANDFIVLGNVADAEIIELANLNGQEEPELFVADNPAAGSVFTNDRIEYKIRHEYNAEIADFRNTAKNVVA